MIFLTAVSCYKQKNQKNIQSYCCFCRFVVVVVELLLLLFWYPVIAKLPVINTEATMSPAWEEENSKENSLNTTTICNTTISTRRNCVTIDISYFILFACLHAHHVEYMAIVHKLRKEERGVMKLTDASVTHDHYHHYHNNCLIVAISPSLP